MATQLHALIKDAKEALAQQPQKAFELAQAAFSQAQGQEAAEAQLVMGKALFRQEQVGQAILLLEAAANGLAIFDKAQELDVLTLLIRLYRERGSLGEAAKAVERAAFLARQIEQPTLEAELLNQHAGLLYDQADYTGALNCLNLALLTSRQLGNYSLEGKYLNNIGILLAQMGDLPKAMEHQLASYKILTEHSPNGANDPLTFMVTGNIGSLYQEMQDLKTALEYYQRALEISKSCTDTRLQVIAYNNMAHAYRDMGELEKAKEHIFYSLQLAQEKSWEPLMVDALRVLGHVHLKLGHAQEALKTHLEALERSRKLGNRNSEIEALLGLAEDSLALGQAQQSLLWASEALELSRQSQRKKSQYEAHRLLAESCQALGSLTEAIEHLRTYHRLEREVFNEENERKQRMISSVLELERARNEAEAYRLRRDAEQAAREKAEAEVAERTEELEQARLEVVSRLALAAEYRDDHTGDHTWRVGRNAAFIARELGWSAEEVEQLRLAARLHDVGKIGISDLILLKPAKLTEEEFAVMRSHTTIGARILSGGHTKLLRMAEEVALTHHERWDGKGYPQGLAGTEIPLVGRIVAVADVLDALTHKRPYKPAWTVEEALAEVQRSAGTQFDPEIVDAAMRVFVDCPNLEELEARLLSAHLHKTRSNL